jgi:hypothetical protein
VPAQRAEERRSISRMANRSGYFGGTDRLSGPVWSVLVGLGRVLGVAVDPAQKEKRAADSLLSIGSRSISSVGTPPSLRVVIRSRACRSFCTA